MIDRTFLIVATVAVIGIAGATWWKKSGSGQSAVSRQEIAINVPELSQAAVKGHVVFDKNCSACHGQNAVGSDQGPPLVHKIYEPNHHGDRAFYLAVGNGVRAHHWPFGNMPRIENVSENDVASIIAYIRELQRANGIF